MRRSALAHAWRLAIGCAFCLAALAPSQAEALITGGEGNKPLSDPGWPRGAAAVFNVPGRVAWWEGPPFGGGEWHAECRGDAAILNGVLAQFAAIDGTSKRVVVHDGVGQSFWLNPNGEPGKRDRARIDWSFTVWQPDRWQRLRALPADLNPTNPSDAATGPPIRLDIYAGGQVRWADVKVPEGLLVGDERLEAHGFTAGDGSVLEGRILALPGGTPLGGKISLERVEPRPGGGYEYPVVAQTDAGKDGRWVLKNTPAGWFRVVAEAPGQVARVVTYVKIDEQPRWSAHEVALATPGPVSGLVNDADGAPLAGVDVRFDNVVASDGARYELPGVSTVRTGSDGRFEAPDLPTGKASIRAHKAGYFGPGLGVPVATPARDVRIELKLAAGLNVKVDFTGEPRPEGYIVEIEPEGGSVVGSWGGSGQIDAANGLAFKDVPPGRYVLRGKPNPSNGSDVTNPVTVELVGGKTSELTLKAR